MNAKANNTCEKAQELYEKLYLVAKRSKTRRFHALFDKVHRTDILELAWKQVKRNHGSAGVDDESITDIRMKGETTVLMEIRCALVNRRYRPRSVKRVYIPKPNGKQRPLGVPTVRDRVVQASAKHVLEPIFEADFLDCSYGFRPNRCTHEALEEIRNTMNSGYKIVLDADIKGFFDNIDHDKLLGFVQQRISDRRILKLIRKWLKCGILDFGVTHESDVGTPQGGVISPLLANIYLHEFDKYWAQQTEVSGRLVRYADDFVILFRTKKDAERGLLLVTKKLNELNLDLNREKTRIVDTRRGRGGFDFLGYHNRMRMCRSHRFIAQKWPSNKSMNSIRSKIRGLLGRRSILKWSIQEVVNKLNPLLIGWMNYFRFGNSSDKFGHIDYYVHERLALWWSKKHQRSGRRWSTGFTGERLQSSGVQMLCGNVVYWYYYRMRKGEGHLKAV